MSSVARNRANLGAKARIDHAVYGLGTILAVSELYTTIQFDDASTRRFVNSLVQLKSTDTPAPTRPVRKKKIVAVSSGKKVAKPN